MSKRNHIYHSLFYKGIMRTDLLTDLFNRMLYQHLEDRNYTGAITLIHSFVKANITDFTDKNVEPKDLENAIKHFPSVPELAEILGFKAIEDFDKILEVPQPSPNELKLMKLFCNEVQKGNSLSSLKLFNELEICLHLRLAQALFLKRDSELFTLCMEETESLSLLTGDMLTKYYRNVDLKVEAEELQRTHPILVFNESKKAS